MRVVAAVVFLITSLVACSDRVPAPVTPTPSPRPGYPPAALAELPEGVLYVQKSTAVPSSLFAMAPDKGPEESVTSSGVLAAAGGPHAVVGSLQGGVILGIGILTGSRYQKVADGPWAMGSPSFLWSDDGRWLAYTVPENEEPAGKSRVWTLDTESGKQVRLTPEAGVYLLLGWTAANDVLAWTSDGLELLGSRRREISLPEVGVPVDTKISPDGRSMAVKVGEYKYDEGSGLTYLQSGGIWVMDLSSGGWREIVDFSDRPPEVESTSGQELLWSPDGTRLVYEREGGGEATNWELRLVDIRTRDVALLTVGYAWGQTWSPDGRYLAYMQAKSGYSEGRRLGILGPDGRTRSIDEHPRGFAWASNGRLLLDIPGRLSLLDPETIEVEDVRMEEGETISVFLEAAIWSPSGRYVAASTGGDAYHRSSLYVVDTEKGKADLFLDEAGFSAVAWVRE